MSDHPLTSLAPSNRVLRRAQTEPFTFSLMDGDVLVRNEGYPNPESHEYLVRIIDGLPTMCTCPAAMTLDGPCKHQVAIAIRRPVLDAAIEMQKLADGSAPSAEDVREATADAETEGEDEIDDETGDPFPGCEHLTDSFPCWECVRVGRRDLPERG